MRFAPCGGLCAMAGALLLNACTALPIQPLPAAPSQPVAAIAPTRVAEAWISPADPDGELDSLAAWTAEDGRPWVIATAKASHRLSVYDGESGAHLRHVGGHGADPGRFARPNGIAVFGDHVFVSERDNRRVQVLALPGFEPVASFGEDELRLPYGLWLRETGPGELEAHITDSFMADFAQAVLPPASELDQRVRRYRVRVPGPNAGEADSMLEVEYLGSYGETHGPGVLHMVESIAGDPLHDRLLIADEDRRVGSTLREYSLRDGRYRGRSLPTFEYDAEGVALWSCGMGTGYWVAVDQLRPTLFRLFEREGLEPAGTFVGERVANTDGIAVHASPTPRFPAGVLYAVHDDRSVAAFDLGEIARALALDPECRP